MLTNVKIEDFRSCHNVVLDNLRPVTVLAGRNAVGKTNILRAIQWAANTAISEKVQQTPDNSGDVSLKAIVGGAIYRYTLKLRTTFDHKKESPFDSLLAESLVQEDSHGTSRIFQRRNEGIILSQSPTTVSIGALTPCIPALVSLMPTDSPVVNSIRPFLSVLERIRYYPLEADSTDAFPHNLVGQTEYDEWLAEFHGTGDPGQSVMKRLLHMSLAGKPQFEEIVGLLGSNGLGLVDQIGVHHIESPKARGREAETKRWYWLNFQPSLQSNRFSFSDLSAGTQRIIRLIISLIFDQSAVMLVEHPEDSIHRGLLRKLLGVLQAYSDQSQLIMSSHSTVVFDTLDPKAIRLVTMEDGVTKVRALTAEELHAAGRFMEEDGSLSDFIETVEED
jgi:predicted ATPase